MKNYPLLNSTSAPGHRVPGRTTALGKHSRRHRSVPFQGGRPQQNCHRRLPRRKVGCFCRAFGEVKRWQSRMLNSLSFLKYSEQKAGQAKM